MLKIAARQICSSHMRKVTAVLPLVAGLIFLAGCQGVSNGGNNAPPSNAPPSNGQLGVSPSTLAVGNVVDGSSGTASASLTASGTSVTVTAVNSSNSVFSVSGLSLPVTIPAGQSVPFTVTFSPQTTGAASATLTFTSNAAPSTTTQTATGTGTATATYSVSLSWDASTSPNISGYNIYRATYSSSCGSFAQLNSSLNTSMSYTDLSVTAGTSYCYATTAVNSSNEQSAYSNIVSDVQIPSQ